MVFFFFTSTCGINQNSRMKNQMIRIVHCIESHLEMEIEWVALYYSLQENIQGPVPVFISWHCRAPYGSTAFQQKIGKDFPLLSSCFYGNLTPYVEDAWPDPLLLCGNPSKVKWIEFTLSCCFYWSVIFSAELIRCKGISVSDLLTHWPLWERCNWIEHWTR